jgi:quinol monooxygenase YgiN
MGRIVIVGYKPKPGKNEALKELMRTHVQRLRNEGLATDRDSIVMEAADGTIVEVFEWLSDEAIRNAHTNPVVLQMWEEYAEVCDYVPVGSLAEAGKLFSEFEPLDDYGD